MHDQVKLSRRDGWLIVGISGDFDLDLAADVRKLVMPMLEAGDHRVIVDLSETSFMDSTALGLVMGMRERVKSYFGDLRVVATQPVVLRVFEITGLTGVVRIERSIDEALQPTAGTRSQPA